MTNDELKAIRDDFVSLCASHPWASDYTDAAFALLAHIEALESTLKPLGCLSCVGCELENDSSGNCKSWIFSKKRAMEAIEAQDKEISKLEIERDAAVEDMKIGPCCVTCAYSRIKGLSAVCALGDRKLCNDGVHGYKRWKWRGKEGSK
jgi:hypothetical protein